MITPIIIIIFIIIIIIKYSPLFYILVGQLSFLIPQNYCPVYMSSYQHLYVHVEQSAHVYSVSV